MIRDAETLYRESLYNRSFVLEHGIPNSNLCFDFMIQDKGWTKFCEHPSPRISPVVGEFHSNLMGRIGTIVYVRENGVDFNASVINKVYNLVDDNSDTCKALFQNTNYQMIM